MKSGFVLYSAATIVLLAMPDLSHAQSNYFFRTPASEINGFVLPAPAGPNGDYFLNDNWFDPTLQNRFIPDFSIGNGERAFIENGGTAVVNTNGGIFAGQIALGNTSGTTGTLEIQDGGVAGAKRGLLTNGNISVGGSGIGIVRVLPGGTLTAEGALAQGNNAANLVRVGGLTGSTATMTAASAVMPTQLQLFPNAAFDVTSGLNFFSTTTYTSEITGNGLNGKIDVGGTATLGGGLALHFNTYTPSVGDNWTVLEAASLDGNFSSITSNYSLGANQNFIASRPAVGGGQTGYNVRLAEVLILEVDRDSGTATIKHPGGANIQLDGYFVGSTVGSLDGADWNSFHDQNILGSGWFETAATATNIAELKAVGDGTILGGNVTNISLGSIYDASAGPFGRNNEDLVFNYRSSDGTQFPGKIQYIGDKVNTLTLQVDPAGTGDAVLRNLSTDTVMIDAYDVLSTSGQLSTTGWDSFDEQNAEGADTWLELSSSATQIGEVNQLGFTTIAPGATLNLGPLFSGGTQDLAFQFLLMGQELPAIGQVVYEAFTGLTGDYNEDGMVDAADYVMWRKLNINGAQGYTDWRANFGEGGAGSGGGEGIAGVPEPTGCMLAVLALLGIAATHRVGR